MIAQTPQDGVGGFEPDYFESLFEVEDRHFWFRTRNDVIALLAARAIANLLPGYRVLEMGCGDGNVLRVLESVCRNGVVVGMDLYGRGLHYASRRVSCPLVQADVRQAPFSEKFQVIGIFDVLEHIPDDIRLLQDLSKLLDQNGTILITVPAHRRLWSYFDRLSGHCRRYSLPELRAKLDAAGFAVEFSSQYMMSLYPLMWLSRRLNSGRAATKSPANAVKDELRVLPILNPILTRLLRFENKWLARRKSLPLGTSLIAVARKKPPTTLAVV